MADPYKGMPGVSDPANNLVNISRDDNNNLSFGIKSLRITNEKTTWITLLVLTPIENVVTLRIPPNCVWIEPLRIVRLFETGSDADALVAGYTDILTGDETKLQQPEV